MYKKFLFFINKTVDTAVITFNVDQNPEEKHVFVDQRSKIRSRKSVAQG